MKLAFDPSGYDGAAAVKLEFQQRPDGVTPVVNPDYVAFDTETTTYKYRIPFEEQAILFPGDQWIKVTVTDRAGNKSTKTVKFAVGAHSVPEAARAVQSADSAALPPPRTLPWSPKVSPDVQKLRLAPSFMKRVRPSWRIPNVYGWLVRGSTAEAVGVAAPAAAGVGGFFGAFVFGEEIERTITNLAVANILIRVQSPIGDIDLPGDVKKINEKHDVLESDVYDAIDTWKRDDRTNYEVWSSKNLSDWLGDLIYLATSLEPLHMLLVTDMMYNGLLLCTPINKEPGDNRSVIPSSFWCGQPPRVPLEYSVPTRDEQWRYVASQVMWQKRTDGTLANPPRDPWWLNGDIDEPMRPYRIDKGQRLAKAR